MSEMVERVARAIYAESYARCCHGERPDATDESWRSYMGEARAALTALAEPTSGMVKAMGAVPATLYADMIDQCSTGALTRAYTAAIAAALGEGAE